MNTTTNTIEGFDIDLMNRDLQGAEPDAGVHEPRSSTASSWPCRPRSSTAAISAFTITPSGRRASTSPTAYYENKGQAIATKPDSTIKNPADLVGHKVAVQAGTVGQDRP